MYPFWIGLLWGLLGAIILVPIVAIVFWKVKQTKMRRNIKVLLDKGEFLKMKDKKDYNTEMWKDKFQPETEEQLEKITDVFIKKEEEVQNEQENEKDEEVLAKQQEMFAQGLDENCKPIPKPFGAKEENSEEKGDLQGEKSAQDEKEENPKKKKPEQIIESKEEEKNAREN